MMTRENTMDATGQRQATTDPAVTPRQGELDVAFSAVKDRAYAMALQITGDREEARDLTQETYVRARRQLGSFRGEGSLQGWLLRILVNLSLKHLRRVAVRRRLRYLIPGPSPEPAADWAADVDQQLQALAGALQTLAPQQRAAFVLRHAQQLPVAEVARLMAVTEPTVKTHLRRAAERLRRQLVAPQRGGA